MSLIRVLTLVQQFQYKISNRRPGCVQEKNGTQRYHEDKFQTGDKLQKYFKEFLRIFFSKDSSWISLGAFQDFSRRSSKDFR